MRILITCDRYPGEPLDGLTLRIFHYVRNLAARHQFDLVCFDNISPAYPELESCFRTIKRLPNPPTETPGNLFSRLAAGLNPGTLYPSSAAAQATLSALAVAKEYDLVWDAGCNMLFNLGRLRHKLPLLADQVDDNFKVLLRSLRHASGFYRRLWMAKQFALQYLFAWRYLRSAEAILFVSKIDADSFRRLLPSARTCVIENGVDESYFSPGAAVKGNLNPELVLEGSMFFEPNIDAAVYFVREILPLIRKEIPGVRFTIVGRDPAEAVRALAGADVEVTGSVPDIRPYLSRTRIFVCPMRLGTGIKNKILQAWAMGLAIVSTTAGVGSLRIKEGENILIRDQPQAFAQGVIDLLRDPGRAARLGAAGRATVEAHYTWAAKAKELEALMEEIVQRHRARRG